VVDTLAEAVAGRCPLAAAAEATPAAIEATMAALVSPAPIFTVFRILTHSPLGY
jgi:hypothetical protein